MDVNVNVLSGEKTLLKEVNSNVNVTFIRNNYVIIQNKINKFKIPRLPFAINEIFRFLLNKSYHFITKTFHLYFFKKYKEKEFDVVIAYNQGIATIYSLYYVTAGKKIVFYHQGHIKGIKRYMKFYKNYDAIIAVSNGVANLIRNEFPQLQNKIQVIKNIIPTEIITRRAEEPVDDFYKLFGDVSGTRHFRFVSCGRLSREKGFDIAVYVAHILIEKGFHDFIWYIIGDGEEKENLETHIYNQEMEPYVKLIGWRENPYPYIKNCDLYIQPSRTESYGIAMAEAQVLGKIVVASDNVGARDVIIQNVNGIISENNASSMASEILAVLADPNKNIQIQNQVKLIDFNENNKVSVENFYKLLIQGSEYYEREKGHCLHHLIENLTHKIEKNMN